MSDGLVKDKGRVYCRASNKVKDTGMAKDNFLTEGAMEGDRATGFRAEKTARTDTPSILPYPVVTKHIGRNAFWPQYACGGPRA